ncbi:MAG: hypothetical protein WAQ52_04340, partial [Terriglobales bacterium]
MSSSRPKLKLDEQSFQDMLAAAFTIQEHNAKRRRAVQPPHVCGQCGAPAKEGEPLCGKCLGEQFRPGEQMQRKWASLWLMSQEQGLWPDHPTTDRSTDPSTEEQESGTHEAQALRFPDVPEIPDRAEETTALVNEEEEAASEWPGAALADLRQSALPAEVTPEIESLVVERSDADSSAAPWNLRDLRLKLRFHRADLYLVVAIIVSTFAMLWVLTATPAPGAPRKPRLRP